MVDLQYFKRVAIANMGGTKHYFTISGRREKNLGSLYEDPPTF